MTTDVFQEVRERVSALDVAQLYGFHPNRAGFIPCPFHHERTASLKLYPGAKGFYCFGCHTGGSVIDFVAQLYGLDAMGAVERLNADFCLALPLHRKPTKAEAQAARRRLEVARAHKEFEEWRETFVSKLCAAYRVAHMALRDMEDLDKLTEREATAIRWQACFEHWADTLDHGTPEDQAQIYRERGKIAGWIEKVLSD